MRYAEVPCSGLSSYKWSEITPFSMAKKINGFACKKKWTPEKTNMANQHGTICFVLKRGLASNRKCHPWQCPQLRGVVPATRKASPHRGPWNAWRWQVPVSKRRHPPEVVDTQKKNRRKRNGYKTCFKCEVFNVSVSIFLEIYIVMSTQILVGARFLRTYSIVEVS